MPRTKAKSRAKGDGGRLRGDLIGLGLVTIGALVLAGLRAPEAGPVLGGLAALLHAVVGRLAEVVPYLFFFVGTWWLLRGQAPPPPASTVGLGLLCLAASGFLHVRVPFGEEFRASADGQGFLNPPAWYGGLVGAGLVFFLRRLVGDIGCRIVLGMMVLAGLVLSSQRSIREFLEGVRERARETAQHLGQERSRRVRRPRPRRQTEPAPDLGGLPVPLYLREELPIAEPPEPEPEPAPSAEAPTPGPFDTRLERPPVPLDESGHPRQMTLPGMPTPPGMSELEEAWYAEGEPTDYRTPPLDLVQPAKSPPLPDRLPEIRANSERLERTLGSFRIEAQVVNTEIGPTVTRYELELAPGIRVSKVAVLADDIAMALASTGIRIEAPVPGKGVIGIEVPNQIREVVHLHSVLTSRDFRDAPGPLPFVVGKDIAGHIKVGELTRMPHVLVAGSTNSGKSVCLNCIIISLLYRLSPRDLRFLMIDPKRVELTLYDGIPHLDRPVVHDPEDAADLLRGAVREMMCRYDRLHALGARNIGSYNAQVDEDERMPYIVVIIDELAELMMLARAEVEASICRIAQLARATGIHLVVATQRPSVNVVTGSIKANIGTRIAFAVAQQVDSRVILDQVGAERLIGRGDMLYSPIDNSKPERIQGAFVDELQVHHLVEYLQAMPSTLRVRYEESIIKPVAADAEDGYADEGVDDDNLDDLFWECVEFVRREGEASTSRLQRTYGIGYNRAGRIMDQMFNLGIVGPPRGSKPREVLATGPKGPSDLRRREPDLFEELTGGPEAG